MKKTLIYITIGFLILVGVLGSYFVLAQGVSFDPNDNRSIGYEFLNNDSVVHIWNTQDDYFFEKDAGIQLTNHYGDYWTRNIFCLGYYSGEEWVKIKCSDELTNFQKSIESDDLTYVNATLWKDISFIKNQIEYNMELKVNYYLGLDDENLSITISGKNIGIDIPVDLGFAWKVTDLDIPSNETIDKIRINNTTYDLDGVYDLTFKDMKKYINTSFPTNQTTENGTIIYNYSIVENTIPFYKIYDYDEGLTGKENFLRIDWNENLNYVVKMFGNGNQDDFYVAILINAGHFSPGVEKSTTFYWIDALIDSLVSYYKLEETSGSNADDAHGSNDGIYGGNLPTAVAGKIDNAQDFVINTDKVDVGTIVNFVTNKNTPVTINMWIYSETASTWQRIFDTSVSEGGTYFTIQKRGDNNKLRFFYDGTRSVDSVNIIPLNTWTMITVVNNGSDISVYMNGAFENRIATNSDSITISDAWIGRKYASTGETFVGPIDEVAIWSRGLSSSEIGTGSGTLYNSGNGFAYPFVLDTCTYSSGNWDVLCSDNCIITEDVNLDGNSLILSGSGVFSLQAEIRNYNKINVWDGCDLLIESSGSIRGN